jgi:hypothetical protein
MNLTTVIVLTRPSMISPVNVLLCAVAICDILVMTSTLIFVVHFHLVAENRCSSNDFSYGWAVFTFIHSHVSVIFHATSIWLTVRDRYLQCFEKGQKWNESRMTFLEFLKQRLFSFINLLGITCTNPGFNNSTCHRDSTTNNRAVQHCFGHSYNYYNDGCEYSKFSNFWGWLD